MLDSTINLFRKWSYWRKKWAIG